MAAYVPPHKRNLPPSLPKPVVGIVAPSYTSRGGEVRYAGPCVALPNDDNQGLGLVGRPHIQFQLPSKFIQGEFKFNSNDDHFSLAIGCESGYSSSSWAMPDTGLHFEVSAECLTVWQRSYGSDYPMHMAMRFGNGFQVTPEKQMRFCLTLGNNKALFTLQEVVPIDHDGDGSGDGVDIATGHEWSLDVTLPRSFGRNSANTAVIFNREKGRLLFLLKLELDSQDYLPELLRLVDENIQEAEWDGELRMSSDAFPQFRINVLPGWEFRTESN